LGCVLPIPRDYGDSVAINGDQGNRDDSEKAQTSRSIKNYQLTTQGRTLTPPAVF
jgi:hypothetical protein